MVVGTLPTGSVTFGNPQPSEPDVVHDHIRLRQHQIVAIASNGLPIGARRLKQTGTTEGGETVGGSSCGSPSCLLPSSLSARNRTGPRSGHPRHHQHRNGNVIFHSPVGGSAS
jgi:hypothetical protein